MSKSEFWFDPSGSRIVMAVPVVASISLFSVVMLFVMLAWVSLARRRSTRKVFLRTQLGVCTLSLMAADAMHSVGAIIDCHWIARRHVSSGPLCTAQAIISNFSGMGIAFWTVIMGIHTLRVLVFNAQTNNTTCVVTFLTAWFFSALIIVIGPLTMQTTERGKFYGVAGYWCSITDEYQMERLALLYTPIFCAAFISVVVYTMIFFRLRGNLVASGWRLHIIRTGSSHAWNLETGRAIMEVDRMKIAWQLMWYPLAYILTVSPLAVMRVMSVVGYKVPHNIGLFGSIAFELGGVLNTILFLTTRNIFPPIKLYRRSKININVESISTEQVSFASGTLSFPTPPSLLPMSGIRTMPPRPKDGLHAPLPVEKKWKWVSEESVGSNVAET